MSILLKIVSNGSYPDHKTFPDSQYCNALIVMNSWLKQPGIQECALFLMIDNAEQYDWVELCRRAK